MDDSTAEMHDCFAGAGKEGFHLKHVEPGRDFTAFMTADVRTVKPGDKCLTVAELSTQRKETNLATSLILATKIQNQTT